MRKKLKEENEKVKAESEKLTSERDHLTVRSNELYHDLINLQAKNAKTNAQMAKVMESIGAGGGGNVVDELERKVAEQKEAMDGMAEQEVSRDDVFCRDFLP